MRCGLQLTDIEKTLRARQEHKTGERRILKDKNPISTPEELKNTRKISNRGKRQGDLE